MSIMHVDHEAGESNKETEWNYISDNEDKNYPDPTPGACFHQIYNHTKHETGRLNPYWILLYNQITLHMFSNRTLLENIKAADKPIGVSLSVGATNCDTDGTLNNIGDVYLHENGLADILSHAKVKDRHNIMYDDVRDFFTVHIPYKRIHFRGIKRELYYKNCKPNGKKRDITFVKNVQAIWEESTKREIKYAEKTRYAYNQSIFADFKCKFKKKP